MDPRMYNAAKKGSTMEDGDFSLVDYLKREEENGYQVTPKGNTILHVAALFGQRGFVGKVLKITPVLLCYKNKKNETALHIAANLGRSEVVSELLSLGGEETILVRMTDDIGDTALHKAVRGGHIDIVRMLVKLLLDPEHDLPANKAGETPLYLAAESGFHDALIEILNVCKEPTYVAGPSNRTPLHAAVIQEHTECARSLWQWNKPLCEASDKWGWNSLHYAVKQGLKEIVSDMLGWKKSLAYLPAGSENDWTTTFHIAASEGDIFMIIELLNHCPDCWEMLNSNGQNAFHVAFLNGHETFFYAFYEYEIRDSLVDEADNEGNTPLHLLAASGNRVPRMILYHPIAKKMTFNKQNQTPLDIALSRTWTIKKEELVDDLCSINGRLGQRDFKVKRKTETIGNIQQMRKEEDDDDKAKRDKIEIEKIMKAAQIQVVVATLLMTVTFAAGFTLPGGLYSDDSPNKGMAILLRKAAFRAFVISDVLAFAFSAGAIFIYFFMENCDVAKDEECERDWFKVLRSYYYIAGILQLLAMAAVVVAFVTGMYATLANSLALAVSVFCLVFERRELHLTHSKGANSLLRKEKLVRDICSINGQLGQRDFMVKRKAEPIGNIQQMKEDDDDKAKRVKIEIEKFIKSSQLHVVVATLIMTVTFAAGFTLPGGLYSDDSPNKGMAILLKRAAFLAFVISDVLAFSCSAGAIFIYFFLANMDTEYDEEPQRDWFKSFRRSYIIAGNLQLWAMAAVVVAFVTGMHATLENSLALAVSVCVIGSVSFLMYFSIFFWV